MISGYCAGGSQHDPTRHNVTCLPMVKTGYYFTGDGARRDQDGFYWITGRVDDVRCCLLLFVCVGCLGLGALTESRVSVGVERGVLSSGVLLPFSHVFGLVFIHSFVNSFIHSFIRCLTHRATASARPRSSPPWWRTAPWRRRPSWATRTRLEEKNKGRKEGRKKKRMSGLGKRAFAGLALLPITTPHHTTPIHDGDR